MKVPRFIYYYDCDKIHDHTITLFRNKAIKKQREENSKKIQMFVDMYTS